MYTSSSEPLRCEHPYSCVDCIEWIVNYHSFIQKLVTCPALSSMPYVLSRYSQLFVIISSHSLPASHPSSLHPPPRHPPFAPINYAKRACGYLEGVRLRCPTSLCTLMELNCAVQCHYKCTLMELNSAVQRHYVH